MEATFRSVGELKRQVSDAGAARFGSGWAWLIHDGSGLAVTSTPNQDSATRQAAT
jgi:Fe-Mn family superoxide dismutase